MVECLNGDEVGRGIWKWEVGSRKSDLEVEKEDEQQADFIEKKAGDWMFKFELRKVEIAGFEMVVFTEYN